MSKRAKTFSELQVDDSAEFSETISAELINQFAKFSKDKNPLHTDPKYAKHSAFGGTIAHGMIAGALFSRLVGMYLPGKYSLYIRQSLNFRYPVRPGATVSVSGRIIHKTNSLNLLSINTKVVDKKTGKLYVDGEAIVKVLK